MVDLSASNLREEFELACIREVSHSGLHLSVGVSRTERRDRIRAAILRENKAQLRWRHSAFSYAEFYVRAYRQALGDTDVPGADSAPLASRYPMSVFEDELDDEGGVEEDDGISA